MLFLQGLVLIHIQQSAEAGSVCVSYYVAFFGDLLHVSDHLHTPRFTEKHVALSTNSYFVMFVPSIRGEKQEICFCLLRLAFSMAPITY